MVSIQIAVSASTMGIMVTMQIQKAGGSLMNLVVILTQSPIHVTLLRGSIEILLRQEYLPWRSTLLDIMKPHCHLELFMTDMDEVQDILSGPHVIEAGIMITGNGVQFDGRDPRMLGRDHHMPVRNPHMLGIDPHIFVIDPLICVIDPLMLVRDLHMIGVVTMIIETEVLLIQVRDLHMIGVVIMIIGTEVLLIQSGPHQIVLDCMIAGTGLPAIRSDPHMKGTGLVITETLVEKMQLMRSGIHNMVSRGRKIK